MKNKILIKLLLVLVFLGCGIFNGGRQLNKQVSQLEDIFMNGENHDQLSVHYDLTKIDDSLSYFLSLAKNYDLANDETIQSLNQLHIQFKENKTIEDYSQWYDQVKDLYPIAIGLVKDKNLTDQHASMLSKYEATLNSSIHTISYSAFNTSVREYQSKTDNFLARLIQTLTHVEGVDTFD
ncbi:MAG: hypothetical protein ACI4U3_01825 [Traorella sp.]